MAKWYNLNIISEFDRIRQNYNEEKVIIFSFILILENLYGYKTKLLINILVNNKINMEIRL